MQINFTIEHEHSTCLVSDFFQIQHVYNIQDEYGHNAIRTLTLGWVFIQIQIRLSLWYIVVTIFQWLGLSQAKINSGNIHNLGTIDGSMSFI